jgi:hypothetical protein
VFCREATFHSAEEVGRLLREQGFAIGARARTLVQPLSDIRAIEPLRPGRGQGAFVVVAATDRK